VSHNLGSKVADVFGNSDIACIIYAVVGPTIPQPTYLKVCIGIVEIMSERGALK
jgi:hypothetical protein